MADNKTQVSIEGSGGILEALIESPDGVIEGTAIVCHPHPLYGGTLNNKVVYTLAKVYRQLGLRSVRFNFRGVGRSEGRFDHGNGEIEDCEAVIQWCRHQWSQAPLHLAGFSFGAHVALRVALAQPPASLITVAPALGKVKRDPSGPICPWSLILADDDDVVDPQHAIRWAKSLPQIPTICHVNGGGHFFHGRLTELGACAREFLMNEVKQHR